MSVHSETVSSSTEVVSAKGCELFESNRSGEDSKEHLEKIRLFFFLISCKDFILQHCRTVCQRLQIML